jgi:hypothetical protein
MVEPRKLLLIVVVERFAIALATFQCSIPILQPTFPLRLDDVLLYQADQFDGQFVDVAVIASAKSVAQA